MSRRAPYGDVDDRIRFIAHSLGLTTVLWDHVGLSCLLPGDPTCTNTSVTNVKRIHSTGKLRMLEIQMVYLLHLSWPTMIKSSLKLNKVNSLAMVLLS